MAFHNLFKNKALLTLSFLLLSFSSAFHAQADPLSTPAEGIYGEQRLWHNITLAFEGPDTSEGASPNPFLRFRMDVTFTHSSGATITVPGYYAADGEAAESSSNSGNIWRVHFTPNLIGDWTYSVSFRAGTNAAIGTGGNPVTTNGIHEKTGAFTVADTNKTGRDFRAHGRLRYVNAHHLQHEGSGRWFFKFGADSPENFLAFVDIDNTPNNISGVRNTGSIHTWQPHVPDWNTGDPQWQGTRGRGAIGAINYLAEQGAHSISTLVYSIDGGDDGRTFPWTSPNTKRRFDTSKLDQWETLFQHANNSGLNITIKLAEEENWEDISGDELHLFYREMVARFGHHLGLTWVISEEFAGFSITDEEREEARFRGDLMADIDPWDNNLVLHTGPGQKNNLYPAITGRAAYSGASLQISNSGTSRNVFNDTLQWRNDSAAAGQPWVVACDEQGPANEGVLDQSNGERKNTIWGNFMAGGAGTEFYVNQASGGNLDASLNDYRRISTMWKWARHCVNEFIYDQNIPFWEMANANNLVNGSSNFCLAAPGDTYVVYLADGGTANLNLNGQSGTYTVRWFDPRNGGALQTSNITSINGGGSRALGDPPRATGSDWAVLIRLDDGSGPPPAAPPAPRTGNFIEQNGFLVMEAESVDLPAGWVTRTTVPPGDPQRIGGFTGEGFIEWTGAQFFGLQIPERRAEGVITYQFTINNPGRYTLRWRTKQRLAGQTFDAGNDSFVRFASGTTPTGQEDFSRFTKVFIQNMQNWDLKVCAEPRRDQNGNAVFITNAFRRDFTAGTHRIQIAARSPGHVIDRLILHRDGVPFNANLFATAPESPREEGNNGGGDNDGGGNETTEIIPTDDAFLQNGNLGTTPSELRIENSASRTRVGYLRFDLSSISDPITSAQLNLTGGTDSSGGAVTVRFFEGSSNNWNENNLSSNTPSREAEITSFTGTISQGTNVSADLSSLITAGGIFTIIIEVDPSNRDFSFFSSEAASPPTLTLTTSSTNAPPLSLTLNTPLEGQRVSNAGPYTITASATSATTAELSLNGDTLETQSGENYTFVLSNLSIGAQEAIITARSATGQSVSETVRFTTISSDYANWLEDNFSTGSINTLGANIDTQDPGGNGLPNIADYALALDPESTLGPDIQVSRIGDEIEVRHRQRAGSRAGVSIILETSLDLTTDWSEPSSLSLTTDTLSADLEEVIYQMPASRSERRRFFRLRIQSAAGNLGTP